MAFDRSKIAVLRSWRHLLALALCAAFAPVPSACSDLEDIEPAVCGNSVLDPGEDCDGHDQGSFVCAALGQPHACRWLCDPASDPATACPGGYACGALGVCSKPSNEFVSASLFDALGGDSMAAGDFDGDGLVDLAIASREDLELRVEFLGTQFELAAEQRIPIEPNLAIASGRVDGDARTDLALGSQASLASFTVAPGRRDLVGTAFSPYTLVQPSARVGAAPGAASRLPDELPTGVDPLEPDAHTEAVVIGNEAGGVLFLRNAYTGFTPAAGTLTFGIERLRGLERAALLPRTGPLCEEMVFPFDAKGDLPAALTMVPLCTLDGRAAYPLESGTCPGDPPDDPEFVCPSSITFAGAIGPIVRLQLDADPQEELVVVELGPLGTPNRLSVVEAIGSKVAISGVRPQQVIDLERLVLDPAFSQRVLAIGDYNGDGRLDVVGSRGIHLTKGASEFYRAGAPLTVSEWSEAVVGDFSGDGRVDVVAARADAFDLDLMIGSELSYFNPETLPTEGQAGLLISGDFDGDGLADLAVRERVTSVAAGLPKCGDLDDVSIRFGQLGGLGPRSIVARAAGIEQLALGRLPRLDKRDSIDDFGFLAHCDPGEGIDAVHKVSVFYGAVNRQVASPFLLNDVLDTDEANSPPSFVPYAPHAIASSHRSGNHLMVCAGAAIQTFKPADPTPESMLPPPSDIALFALTTEPDGTVFSSNRIVPLVRKFPGVEQLERSDFRVAIAELDGSFTGELDDEEIIFTLRDQLHVVRGWTAFTFESGLDSADLVLEHVVSSTMPGVVRDLAAGDLDGDLADDVVVYGETPEGTPFLRVLWSGDSEVFRDVDLAGARSGALALLPLYSATTGEGPPSPQSRALIFAAAVGGSFEVRQVSFQGRAASPAKRLGQNGYADVRGIAVADMDGDRFEDIVVLRADSTEVLVRSPVFAGDAEGAP